MPKKQPRKFIMLYNDLIDSEAWKNLPPSAFKALCLLLRHYNGHNNGEISLSCRQIEKKCKMSKATANRALKTLQEFGFTQLNNKGHFGNRHASTWFLTFRSSKLDRKMPTYTYRGWKKP